MDEDVVVVTDEDDDENLRPTLHHVTRPVYQFCSTLRSRVR